MCLGADGSGAYAQGFLSVARTIYVRKNPGRNVSNTADRMQGIIRPGGSHLRRFGVPGQRAGAPSKQRTIPVLNVPATSRRKVSL